MPNKNITTKILGLTFKSGRVVLYTGQVQVVIPSLCVLINTVVLALRGRDFCTLLHSDWTKQKHKTSQQ